MKRIFLLAIGLVWASAASAQDSPKFFERLKNLFVVHDTVFIPCPCDTIVDDATGDDDEGSDVTESIPMPVDTLDTRNKFTKVVLFDNGTWLYYEMELPFDPDSLGADHWVTEKIHSYQDIALKDLPDSVMLVLVDSLHRYCIPHPGRITSRYKYRWRRAHKGIDIGLEIGDAIYAAFDGMVRVSMETKMSGGYGNVLVIRHPNGLETYYGHMSKYLVDSGDIVRAGELIGYGGSTGRSTGPHLHFETRYMGQAFDPERIFDFENGKLRCDTIVLKKHYFSINSHYGMTDKQSAVASKKKPTSSGGGGAVYYKVKKGDTLGKIASRNGTTVQKLCKLNGLKPNTTLKIGQRIRVK